jgi:hypothetical protein
MTAIIHIFSACGSLVLGCAIIVFAGAIAAFAGAALGLASSVRIVWISESSGLTRGLIWGGVVGALLALYTIFSQGFGAACLAAIGLAVVTLIMAGLELLILPERFTNAGNPGDCSGN